MDNTGHSVFNDCSEVAGRYLCGICYHFWG